MAVDVSRHRNWNAKSGIFSRPVDKDIRQQHLGNTPLLSGTDIGIGASESIIVDANNSSDLEKALLDRDEVWRKHEKKQIDFVQNDCAQMLAKLHKEVERLMNSNRELEMRLFSDTEPQKLELERVKAELSTERKNSAYLRRELGFAAKRNAKIAQTLEKTAQIYKDQISKHEETIRQLNEKIRNLSIRNVQIQSKMCWSPRHHQHQPNMPLPSQRRSHSGDPVNRRLTLPTSYADASGPSASLSIDAPPQTAMVRRAHKKSLLPVAIEKSSQKSDETK